MSGRSQANPEPANPTARGCRPADRTIDLWHADLRHSGWPRLLNLLSDQEHRRADAFAFEREARRYVVSHAVLRTLLGAATDTAAAEIRLRTGQGLKPALEPRNGPPLHFSLSRSDELVMIGLASQPLGVDVERLTVTADLENLASLVLTSREQIAFRSLEPILRPAAFLQCWTRKEAYLKAIGTGLAISPSAVEICFECGRSQRAQRQSDTLDHAVGWSIDVVAPVEGYLGATAIRGRPCRLECKAFDTRVL